MVSINNEVYNTECVFCLGDIKTKSRDAVDPNETVLKCNHAYCSAELEQWFSGGHDECPLCNVVPLDVNESNFVRTCRKELKDAKPKAFNYMVMAATATGALVGSQFAVQYNQEQYGEDSFIGLMSLYGAIPNQGLLFLGAAVSGTMGIKETAKTVVYGTGLGAGLAYDAARDAKERYLG
jgi:hypothetical protein